jgi:cysteinyl-tRNA synthetase
MDHQILISNTLTGRKETLVPKNSTTNHIGIYACGVTVYDDCHIGHAMQAIYFDIVKRYLKYVGYNVTYVRNYTDVDDKIIARAKERGMSSLALSQQVIESSIRDMKAIGVSTADFEPKVSESIPEIIKMIEDIIANDMAYKTISGDVYFRVRRKSDYGKLSNRKPDELRSGARDVVVGEKEDELDFALWKADSTEGASWDSPWSKGRPGWHIECSAMAKKYLGSSFEIHGGGRDLVFPHHENEIAQSEAANKMSYANCWMHSGLLTIQQQKMSKSLGNHISIQAFLSRWPAEVMRLGFLMNHYQSNIDFSEKVFQTCAKRLIYYYEQMIQFRSIAKNVACDSAQLSTFKAQFRECMNDDFNTPKVVALLNQWMKQGIEWSAGKVTPASQAKLNAILEAIKDVALVTGLLSDDPESLVQNLKLRVIKDIGVEESFIASKIEERRVARTNKDFAASDRIRDELATKQILLKDTPSGTNWTVKFNPSGEDAT